MSLTTLTDEATARDAAASKNAFNLQDLLHVTDQRPWENIVSYRLHC